MFRTQQVEASDRFYIPCCARVPTATALSTIYAVLSLYMHTQQFITWIPGGDVVLMRIRIDYKNWCILSKTVRFIPFIVSTHRLSCPARPAPPPPRPLLFKPRPPRP